MTKYLSMLMMVVFLTGCHTDKKPETLTISAAASFGEALKTLVQAYNAENPQQQIRLNVGGSGMLARQIEAGANVDVFISADVAWARYLVKIQKTTFIDSTTFGNRITVYAHNTSLNLYNAKRIALADPRSVPAGRYAKEALQCMGVWSKVSTKIIPVQDVNAVIRTLKNGAADLGFAYASDATPDLRGLNLIPKKCLPEIRYGITSTKKGWSFLQFITSEKARKVFAKQGFMVFG